MDAVELESGAVWGTLTSFAYVSQIVIILPYIIQNTVKSARLGPSNIAEILLRWSASYASWTKKLHGKPLIIFHSIAFDDCKTFPAFVIIIVASISLTLKKTIPFLSIIMHCVVCVLYENVFRMCMRRIHKNLSDFGTFPCLISSFSSTFRHTY